MEGEVLQYCTRQFVGIEITSVVNDSSTYLMKGEMKNSIPLLSPVLISAVTAIPGARGTSLPLTRMLKRLGFNLTL
jgi:hypothetical protein